MSKNTSNVDRIIRVVLAVAFFAGAALVGFGTIFGIILGVLGVVMVVTAAVGFCPLYRLFGLSTSNTPATK